MFILKFFPIFISPCAGTREYVWAAIAESKSGEKSFNFENIFFLLLAFLLHEAIVSTPSWMFGDSGFVERIVHEQGFSEYLGEMRISFDLLTKENYC